MKHPLLLCLMALGTVASLSAFASASHVLPELNPASGTSGSALVAPASPILLAGQCHRPQYRGGGYYRRGVGYGPGYGYGYGSGYRRARYQYYRGGPVGYRPYGYSNSLYGYGPGLNVGRGGGGFGLYIGF